MAKKAVFPGTFDPLTNGHLDIIVRSHRIFDYLLIAVAEHRVTLLSVSERILLIKEACANLPNIEVVSFSGLLVDFIRLHKAQFVIRGLRDSRDFAYERQMACANHQMAQEIETIFFPAYSKQEFLSASLVREIFTLGGDITTFVPKSVANFLATKKIGSCND